MLPMSVSTTNKSWFVILNRPYWITLLCNEKSPSCRANRMRLQTRTSLKHAARNIPGLISTAHARTHTRHVVGQIFKRWCHIQYGLLHFDICTLSSALYTLLKLCITSSDCSTCMDLFAPDFWDISQTRLPFEMKFVQVSFLVYIYTEQCTFT